jgi:hypothetical protein
MPFPPQKPRPFDRESVESLRAGVVGCYGLFRRERWVYIGGGDIRRCLLAHLDGETPAIVGHRPTHWVSLETPDYEALARELILDCDPVCKGPGRRSAVQNVQATGRCGSGR